MEDGTVIEYAMKQKKAVKEAGRLLAKKLGTDDIRVIPRRRLLFKTNLWN